MFDFIVFVFITPRKQLFSLAPVTLELLNYQLLVLCKKYLIYEIHDALKHLCLQHILLLKKGRCIF